MPDIFMDGHVHITNRVYWEGIDPWKHQPIGPFDYARAFESGLNVVVENVAAYSYRGYNGTLKQVLRLIETFHRMLDGHSDKMELALTSDDARRIVAKGKLAVILGIEAGFDQEGDLDILGIMHRLGVRCIQFASQSPNAYSDVFFWPSSRHNVNDWNGINQLGRALVREMNRLGIVIDITHASHDAQLQIIDTSEAPVISSHNALVAVSGKGIADDVLRAISAKGGVVGIHGTAPTISPRYNEWAIAHRKEIEPQKAAVDRFAHYEVPFERKPYDQTEYIHRVDAEMRRLHHALFNAEWKGDPAATALIPTVEEWVAHVQHVIDVAGPEHVGVGLDSFHSRSHLDASSYPRLFEAVRGVAGPKDSLKIAGENWLRVFDAVREFANARPKTRSSQDTREAALQRL